MIRKIAAGIILGFVGIVVLVFVAEQIIFFTTDQSGQIGESARELQRVEAELNKSLCDSGSQEACDRLKK